MKKQPTQFEDDDGRVICSMDVDGTPWRDRRVRPEAGITPPRNAAGHHMTSAEARKYSWYSLLAGLLIVLVFSVTWILFTLFCTQIWFR